MTERLGDQGIEFYPSSFKGYSSITTEGSGLSLLTRSPLLGQEERPGPPETGSGQDHGELRIPERLSPGAQFINYPVTISVGRKTSDLRGNLNLRSLRPSSVSRKGFEDRSTPSRSGLTLEVLRRGIIRPLKDVR